MAPFRSKILDIGSYVSTRNLRDHTKRKVFAENEPLRYALTLPACISCVAATLEFPPCGIRMLLNGRHKDQPWNEN